MQLVNTETIPGWNITEVKGLVSGTPFGQSTSDVTSVLRSRTWPVAS